MLDPISQWLLSGAGRNGPVTLMYHSVRPGRGTADWTWAVSQQRFDEQMELLQQDGWRTCTVSELAAPGPLPDKSVAITFDDGYQDNHQAFMSLARRGMRGTLFMVSSDVGGRASWQGEDGSGRPMLDKTQLLEMLAAGMEVGCHTRSHPRLTQLDDHRLRDEVSGGRNELQDQIDAKVNSFAYPYGDYDARVVDAVREAGFAAACVTRSGSGRVDGDPLRLRRLAVIAEDNLATFARKLAFADNEAGWSRVGAYYLGRVRARFTG